MYKAFFQLNDLPFRLTPDLDYFFQDGQREEVVTALLYTLERGDGIIKVVGEVGSGKTTLLRRLDYCLPEYYRTVYINSPNLSAHDILFFICVEFGLDVSEEEQKFFLTKKLQSFLLSQHTQGQRPLLLIDEAQAMPIDTLEEIRLLTNLETGQDKLLQIVLFGQPELDKTLSQPEIRQFQTRITQSIYLKPFSASEVYAYLNFRLTKAGYHGKPIFSKRVARLIHRKSGGVLRTIHSMADHALLAAYADDSKEVKPRHLTDTKPLNLMYWVTGLLVLIGLLAFLVHYLLYNSRHDVLQFQASDSAQAWTESEYQQDIAVMNKQEGVRLDLLTDDEGLIDDGLKEIDGHMTELSLFEEVPIDVGARQAEAIEVKVLVSQLAEQEFNYTVQLITGSLQEFNDVYERISRLSVIEKADIFYMKDSQQDLYRIYHGFYSGVTPARAFIDQLPRWLANMQPYVLPKSMLIEKLKAVNEQEQDVQAPP